MEHPAYDPPVPPTFMDACHQERIWSLSMIAHLSKDDVIPFAAIIAEPIHI
jgi:hypothetical protein